jgi:SAM-dependent methyltransferase
VLSWQDPAVHENRLRAESFGGVAERYDRVRPRYPAALLDALLERRPERVLDVGCGTGIAGCQIAARGASVLGVEPDPRMAAVARAHGLEVEVATFERWEPAGRRFDLVTAAQAWHWVEPEGGAAQAATLLGRGGRIGVFWNFGDFPPELGERLARNYARLAPELQGAKVKPGDREGHPPVAAAIAGIVASGAFEAPLVRAFPWTQRYDAATWREMLTTHSDHLTMAPERRERLLDAVEAEIASFGGSLVMPYEATLVEARRI